MPVSLKLVYGIDPLASKEAGGAFYWPDAPSKRAEVYAVKRGNPSVYESTYQNRPGQREGSIFLESDFIDFIPPSQLSMGCNYPTVREFLKRGTCKAAWDTAFTKTKSSAFTVCVVGLFVPCNKYHRGEDPAIYGPCEFHFDVLILDVFREKVDWGGLVKAFKDMNIKWRPEEHIIELKASGIPLFQSLQATGIPIIGVEPTMSKKARAVEGVQAGSAQGWMRQHRMCIPQAGVEAPWRALYKAEMKDFSGADDATSDQVDATVHILTNAILMGANSAHLPTDWTPERGTPVDQTEYINSQVRDDPRAEFLNFLGSVQDYSTDPFAGTCSRCDNYSEQGTCSIHRRAVVSLDTCEFFTEPAPGSTLQ